MQDSAPLGDCWAPRSGRVHGSGRPGNLAGPEDETYARSSGRVGFRGPGVACVGPGKASEGTRTWKMTFGVPGRTTCAKPGEWSRLRGGGDKILVAPEGAKKLGRMRGAEPRLPSTWEWIWEREVKDCGSATPHLGAPGAVLFAVFPLFGRRVEPALAGARTGAGQPQPSQPAGRGGGTG